MYNSYFFFNDTATTEIYTLSLHDALPISPRRCGRSPPATPVAREAAAPPTVPNELAGEGHEGVGRPRAHHLEPGDRARDRKSTRLNSSHANISYAVFCLKKKFYSITTW